MDKFIVTFLIIVTGLIIRKSLGHAILTNMFILIHNICFHQNLMNFFCSYNYGCAGGKNNH